MIKKLFNFLFKRSKKLPHQVYEEFINNNINFDSLDLNTQKIIMEFIGTQCSSFISNDFFVRVTEEDVLNHVYKKIDIFELQQHINSPSINSPEKIYLGGNFWKLDKNYMIYYKITLNDTH